MGRLQYVLPILLLCAAVCLPKEVWGQDIRFAGITGESGGVMFTLDPQDQTTQRTLNFIYEHNPLFSMSHHGGKLYGTTSKGGFHGLGVLFSLDLNGSNYEVLHSFSGPDGRNPNGQLLMYGGKIWGVTQNGGTGDDGVLFSYDPDTDDFVKRLDMQNEGISLPKSGLILLDGLLYGTTNRGGTSNRGTIFKVDPATGLLSVIHEFSTNTGANPFGRLAAVNGKLLGTTERGIWQAANSHGTIFQIDADGQNFQILHDFVGAEGSQPRSGLTPSGGRLWGTTKDLDLFLDGTQVFGTIYSIQEDGTDFRVEHSFRQWPFTLSGGQPFSSSGRTMGCHWSIGSFLHRQ